VARMIGRECTRQHGRVPDAAEFRRIERFARFITLNGADTRPAEPELLLRGWQAQERADVQAQYQIRRDIARAQARAGPPPEAAQERARAVAYPVQPRGLSEDHARQVMAEAIAVTQARISAWTKADLLRYLGEALPAGTMADRATLESLASRAISGAAGERVELLSAPEWPRVPDGLRRADGESVFRPHGAERYASQAQLSLEERLLAQAQEPGAPHLDPAVAARLLGADAERLQAQLQPAPDTRAPAGIAGSGLRMDQAAAAWYVLTSPRRAEVMIGPAGTGKTRTAIEMARAWQQAGIGPVVALTASSNARNVLREEAARHGVTGLACYNTAEWLGHAKSAREARTPVELAPGTLITLDEASMTSLHDLAAVLRRAAQHGAKIVVTGDPVQLQAVEGGGGMALLARHLGYVQLGEASRFTCAWERQATLRLRDGDVTVLTDYRQHDRLHVGKGEDMLEDAARAYLHDRLNGKDTLLMTSTDARAAELSRRVRQDLIRWGIVSDGPIIRLRDGAHASAGDWIMARRNDKRVKPGHRGGDLTNRDVLKINDTDPDGTGLSVQVARLIGRNETGLEQWSAPFLISRQYLWNQSHLAYAVTFHAAEGRTVDSGIAVFTGEEDRQATYVAMSRGRDNNEAFVIAGWRIADPQPGPEPAPELARQERLDREHAGLDTGQAAQGGGRHEPGMTAEQILAQCLDRDGQQLAATDTRAAEWSDADRLDVLAVQWQHVIRDAAQHRYEAALRASMAEEEARQVLADPADTWLWRTLREAEAAGLDSAGLLRRAAAAGPLTDAASVAKVLDWRIRQHTDGMPALAARPWTSQVPQTGDPDTDRYASELAAGMDDRQRRLGEHAAEHPPAWAHGLGPVPEHPVDRAAWELQAGRIAAYREMWGYTHPTEPIGARPGQHSPEARASWQAATEALGRQPGDLTAHSDGQLWAWRSAFAREMEWAPPYKGDELAMVRGEIRRAQIDADRARRDAQAAATGEARQRLTQRAGVYARWEQMTRDVAARLAEAQAGYDAWEHATGPTRDRAVAADAELRRRHPDARIEPLRAQPQPGPDPAGAAAEPAPPTPQHPAPSAEHQTTKSQNEPAPARQASRMDQIAGQLREISARLDEADMRKAQQAREKAAEITSLHLDPGEADSAPSAAWQTDFVTSMRQTVRHEPLPRVPHAPAIEAEGGINDREAAD
jgi:AAA domain